MTFKALKDQVSVVFLGTFNPRIFEPVWLLEEGIVTRAEYEFGNPSDLPRNETRAQVEDFQAVVITQQVAQVTLGAIQIIAELGKLTINANSQDAHPRSQEIAIAIQSKLPHTPVEAVGLNRNFVFVAQSPEAWHKIGHTLIEKNSFWLQQGENPGTLQCAVRYSKCKVPGAGLNIVAGPDQSEQGANKVLVNCNYHFNLEALRSSGDSSTRGTPARITRMCDVASVFDGENWEAFYSHALEIATSTFDLGKT